jgi:hypothetical protein
MNRGAGQLALDLFAPSGEMMSRVKLTQKTTQMAPGGTQTRPRVFAQKKKEERIDNRPAPVAKLGPRLASCCTHSTAH